MGAMDSLEHLAAALARLPGLGRKSAERMAVFLAREPDGLAPELIDSIQAVRDALQTCERCGFLTPRDRNPCRYCTDPARDGKQLCVVEDIGDISAIERSGGYRGRYHALQGRLSPMQGTGPGQLRLQTLLERIQGEDFEEVVLALNTNVESDATASFLADTLKGRGVRVTRLAAGLPAGSGVMYSDAVTLARAMEGRQRLD